MERWNDDNNYNISWYGINANQVPRHLYDNVMAKIAEYTRGPPVRAKVVMIDRIVQDRYDSLGIVRVNGTLYLVALTNMFMIKVDLHYVKNDIVSMFLDNVIEVEQ